MDKQLKEFYEDEVDRGHLNFEAYPEYIDLLCQSEALFLGGDLPKPIFDLLDTSNFISFAHGLKLGLRLKRWSAHPKPSPLGEGGTAKP